MNGSVKHLIALLAALLAGLLVYLLLGGCTPSTARGAASAGVASEPTAAASPTITVTAASDISVVPDKAQIGVAVTTQAKTAEETQEQNGTQINAVTEALKALGIDEKSIQTTYTYMNPRYDYSQAYGATFSGEEIVEDGIEGIAEAESDDASNIVGYEMTTNLTVKDLDIDQVGEVLRACVAAGANNTDGIQYYSSEYDAKYAEALAAAVDDAYAKAEVLAKAAGAQLGGVVSITEGYQNTAYRYDAGMGAMEAAAASEDSMKVNPGKIDIAANITVTYKIS